MTGTTRKYRDEIREHDREAVDALVSNPFLALLEDPGLGKTPQVLEAFRQLREDFEANRMLVVAPLGVAIDGWPAEVQKWAEFSGFRVSIIHGTEKKRLRALAADAEIYVINPQGLPWLLDQKWAWPDVLVVDELHRFKRLRSSHFRAIRQMLRRFRRRYGLTGTPVPKRYLQLFPQMFIIDKGESLGTKMEAYKQRWFYPHVREYGVVWEPKRGAAEEIAAAIAPRVLRIEGHRLKGLPPVIESDVFFDLAPAVMERYREFKKEKVLEFGAGEVTAANAGVLANKLRQFANGRVYVRTNPDPKVPPVVEHVHSAKSAALSNLLDELGGKNVLVAYSFDSDLLGISEAIGREVPAYNGETSKARRSELKEAWNRGEIEVLAVHPQTAGIGLNLQEGGHVLIWWSMPWEADDYDQTIKRLHRPPQPFNVLVYRLKARGTYDERVAQVVRRDIETQEEFLRLLKRHVAEP